jgi:beta-galactosidase/beta-glucuronidase
MRHRATPLLHAALGFLLLAAPPAAPQAPTPAIPLPEHPRPDFQRAEWVNLNGDWAFRFDRDGSGERERWFEGAPAGFPLTIRVPFSWGSRLSGVPDEADVAWYARTVRVPEGWKGKRVFLVVGASDWRTSGWLDGEPIGAHQGGYTPFELDLTKAAKPGRDQVLVLRVDDTPHPFKLEGKQGYGKARGLWQTVYLEARPALNLESVEFHPDPALKRVEALVRLSGKASEGAVVEISVPTGSAGDPSVSEAEALVAAGGREARLVLPLGERPRLWSLEDPHLYDATLTLTAGKDVDRVRSYFGLRKLGVEKPAGLGHPYVALNGKPVYLQMALDQSWNPDGYWSRGGWG